MVTGPRVEVLSAGVRRTIQSIKEIVGDHSDADIYAALKETNMDPNETAQKLLNQDPFHEVRRKRDRKRESSGSKVHVATEPRKNTEVARRGGSGRNAASGSNPEFRVVRDNRLIQNAAIADSRLAQTSTSEAEGVITSGIKSNLTETSGLQKPPVSRHSSQALNSAEDSQPKRTKGSASGGNGRKEVTGESHFYVTSATSRVQTKANVTQPHSASSSGSSVVGVYSSSSDPVHVPSLHSRSSANVGGIRREVGVVGPRNQPSENSANPSSSQRTFSPNTHSGRDVHPQEPARTFNSTSKSDQSNQNKAPESTVLSLSRPVANNQYGSRSHQQISHQKAPQPNKEWKPKSSLKPKTNSAGIIGSPTKTTSPPADNLEDVKKESEQMQDDMSRLNLSHNVIIAAHIQVSETDRCRLTFGSLGTGLDASINLVSGEADEQSTEPFRSVPISAPESSGDESASINQLEVKEDFVRSSESFPASGVVPDCQLTEEEETSSPPNPDSFASVELVRGDCPSDAPESLQQQNDSELPSFLGYDPQMGYETSYFHPIVGDSVQEPGLPSSQEVLTTNAIPASTIPMVPQQQQQQLTQMYPQLHVPNFANLMAYRQFLSPVYVPPIHVPGYSNSPAYPHPSNGGSYLLMPGNSSHLAPSGVKYGLQQLKPVPTATPAGFGNFSTPIGYAVNTPGPVVAGHEDSSRHKYKDNFYAPNPQAETSEIWVNPRDLPGLQSASYYNIPGQTSHPTYLTSHGGHASLNAAAQSSHMQFPGMYRHPPQPAAIASPHRLGPAMAGNVGVGVAAPSPGAQVGPYQQPQVGHLNWTGNF